jgi:GNAT superfamily N-acetyltransferase
MPTNHRSTFLQATKFAVIELDVIPAYQGHRLGKALLHTLLSERREAYATLASMPGSQAQAMYERWGWFVAGTIGGEGPVMDAMVIELHT